MDGRFQLLDDITVKSIEDTRFLPVARISKIFHKPLVSASSRYIAYPTSKPGVIRVVDQQNGNHVALNTTDIGGGIEISYLEMREVSTTETMLVVSCPDILTWTFQHGMELENPPVGINISKSFTFSAEKISSVKLWISQSTYFITKLLIGVDGEGVKVAELNGNITTQATVEATIADFGLGDYPNLTFVTKSGSVYHWNVDESEPALAANISAPPVSVSLINKSQALVTGKNQIHIIALDSPAYDSYGLKLPNVSIKKAVFQVPNIVCVDELSGDLLVIQLASSSVEGQSIKFQNIVKLSTGLNIYDVGLTKNLENRSVIAFDAYILHSKGLSILPVKLDEIAEKLLSGTDKPLAEPSQSSTSVAQQSPTTISTSLAKPSPTVETPATTNSSVASVVPVSVNAAAISSPPAVGTTLKSRSVTPKPPQEQQVPPKPVGKGNLLDSYSRNDFKEKTYTMKDLLASGQFVSKTEFDHMRDKFAQHISRLEQKLSSLDKKLDILSNQGRKEKIPNGKPEGKTPETRSSKKVRKTSEKTAVVEEPKSVAQADHANGTSSREETPTPSARNEQSEPVITPTLVEPLRAISTSIEPTRVISKPIEAPKPISAPANNVEHSPSPIKSPSIVPASPAAVELPEPVGPPSFVGLEQKVIEMVGAIKGTSSNSLDSIVTEFLDQFDSYNIKKETGSSEIKQDLVYLSALSCLTTLASIDEKVSTWINKLLEALSLSADELYSDDGNFINSVIRKAKQNYIEHSGSNASTKVLINFNYQEKISSSRLS